MGVGGRDIDDGIITGAVYTELTVGVAAVELKVGGSALADRVAVTMQPKDNNIYWGYDNTVTSTTGTQIFKNQFLMLPIGEDQAVWLIADGAGKKVVVSELASSD